MKKRILAIETSCDETAAAIIVGEKDNLKIASNVVASQIDLHKKYGGVYPEVASRAHAEQILPVTEEALEKANISKDLQDIDAIAVTYGPGLVGSLVIGLAAAKTLAYKYKKPIIPINHWEGHIYSVFLEGNIPEFPALFLTVSGGHTSLILMKGHGDYEILGQTLDDAAGEAFDKVARLLGLGYPGGPAISVEAEKLKDENIDEKYTLPRPMINSGDLNFSFSGLKTAVLYKVRDLKELKDEERSALAMAFQEAITDTLITKTTQAIEKHHPKSVCLTGGVSANKVLRGKFLKIAERTGGKTKFYIPPFHLTTDNAAMIGAAGYFRFILGKSQKWYDIGVESGAILKPTLRQVTGIPKLK